MDRGKAGGRSWVRMGGALAPPRTRLTHKMPRNCRGSRFSATIGPVEVLCLVYMSMSRAAAMDATEAGHRRHR